MQEAGGVWFATGREVSAWWRTNYREEEQ
jgi:hypothetical protein